MIKFFLMALLFNFPDKEYVLKDFRWKNRLILIGGENQDCISNQTDAFLDQRLENKDRRLLIFRWNEQNKTFHDVENGFVLKEPNFKRSFELRLYGLDGGLKVGENQVIDPQYIYDLIDAMPMRLQELRKKED